MSATILATGLVVVMFATLLCVTDWTARRVLELPSKRPLRAAAATLALSALTVGPAVYGIDALLGGDLSDLSRILLWLAVGVAQTGLILRLVYGSTVPVAFAQGVVLQLTWAAVSILVVLCDRLGGLYFAAPLALILGVYFTGRAQDRELLRRFSSVPPSPPPASHPDVVALVG